jgi:hypothetical protein
MTPRKQVLAELGNYLKTPVNDEFLTSAGGRVFEGSAVPPDVDELPEVHIVFIRETKDSTTNHRAAGTGINSPVRRIMEVSLEVYHTGPEALDIAWEVEEAFRQNPTLSGSVEGVEVDEVALYVAENSELAIYAGVMTATVAYWTHIPEDEGGRPVTVLLGFSPSVGPGNEEDYSEIIGAA